MALEAAEPKTLKEALSSTNAQLWKAAAQEEMDSLMRSGTWTLTVLPENRKTIQNRWIFKVKPGHNDTPERYKARLVAKGYTQRKGFDYEETFFLVVKATTLRLALGLVASLDLEMMQLDIKTAFLNGHLETDIYMDQPEGFVIKRKEDQVVKLLKSLYGLKQALRCWNTKFNDFLLKFGLTRSNSDPCLYFRRQGEEFTLV